MMSVSGNWKGDDAYKFVVATGWERLLRAAVFFWNALQVVLNVANPKPYRNSAPKGEPPHKRTGFGADSVLYQEDQAAGVIRVGVLGNAKYMAFHELKDHPWLMPTLAKVMPQLKAIAESGGKK